MKKETSIKKPVSKGIAKVPVVIQMEALECGAASLTMVLEYYENYIPLERVRKDCGVSRDGSNARNILIAARNYGLEAKAYRLDVDDLKVDVQFPCILHWNMNHFVLLKGFKKNKVYLNDPARGNIVISMEEFSNSFTGIVLTFAPTKDFKKEGHKESVLPFALKKVRGTGVAFFFVLITSVISSLIGLASPGFSNFFIDRLLTQSNPEWFIPFIVIISVFFAVQVILQMIDISMSKKIDGKLATTSNSQYMWHILNLPLEFYEQRTVGDLISRKRQNSSIARTLINSFVPLLFDSIMMIFYLVVAIKYSWVLTLVGISSVLLNSFLSRIISKRRINLSRVNYKDDAKLGSITYSGINMIDSIKASGAESGYYSKWLGYQAIVNNNQVKLKGVNVFFDTITSIIALILSTFIFMAGVYLCMNGEWTVGMISAFSGFLSGFLSPATKLITFNQTLQEMKSSMERIEDVMEYKEDKVFKDEELESYDKLKGKVEFKNVTFGYSRLGEPVLKNISFEVEPGESIALVGGSGSGKSTISKLLCGLYKIWDGEILFDGIKINDINKHVINASLSCVDQDIIVFEDTVANNIKMWDDSIEDYEMILAARDAKIHDVIISKDGGYDHKMSSGGKEFSGGERQRLEIARVLANEPTIIILDEATSALDAKTEKEVVESIKRRGITCVIIAHRLSTIRDADKIVVLDKGEIVERGNHSELMKKKGKYHELVSNE